MRLLSHYHKAYEKRLHGNNPLVVGARKGVIKAAGINFVLLQVVFLGLFCYIMGSLFHTSSRVKNMKILYIDNDGGPVGDSVRQAYRTLQSPQFPAIIEKKGSDFKTLDHDVRDEVCQTNYWAALYTTSGASQRLEAAFSGGPASTNYNRSNALVYVWNEALFPPTSDSYIVSNLQTLSASARSVYISKYGGSALGMASQSDSNLTALSLFADPWRLTSINIQKTSQGARLIYNTLVIILLMIQEFFFLGTINGLHGQFKIWPRLYPIRIYNFRLIVSLCYTFIGSLCVTGAIWAFRAGWDVNGNQFVASWMALWLFAHVNFLTLDVFSVYLPHPCLAMALISWLMLNITSILLPFELVPGFYRWAYVMPAHSVYHILMDIWSRGCNPQLYYALPVLFVEELSGLILVGIGVYRRCHYALIAEEAQEKTFQDMIAGLKSEKAIEAKLDAKDQVADVEEQKEEVQELEAQVRSDGQMLKRQETAVSFGPSFGVAYQPRSQGV